MTDHGGGPVTRVTRQLLQHFGIGARTVSLHQHNEPRAAERVLALLQQGKSVALVSDAGTPAISDPGALLVKRARDSGARVIPVPGPSALTAALSVAGLRTREFVSGRSASTGRTLGAGSGSPRARSGSDVPRRSRRLRAGCKQRLSGCHVRIVQDPIRARLSHRILAERERRRREKRCCS